MHLFLRTLILVSIIGYPSLAAAAASNDMLRTVALRGQPALGPASDARFQSFSTAPILNANGQTAFAASLQVVIDGSVTALDDTGIWSEGSGALALVARERSPAPGTLQGTNFQSFSLISPSLNDAGQTAFAATLVLGANVFPSNDSGVWSELGGPLSLVTREGTQFMGEPAGAGFSSFSTPIRISDDRVAFSARLQTGPGGVTTANDSGIWRSNGSTLEVVAREGGQAPSTDAGVVFRDFDGSSFALGAGGHVAFLGRLLINVGGVTATNDTGIWTDGSGPLALLAREGSQAPGTPPGASFGGNGFGPPSINAVGQAAFHANLQIGGSVTGDNDSGIWSQNGNSLDLVAREGDQAPGTPAGATFWTLLNPPAINIQGETVFAGSLRSGVGGVGGVTSDNDTGIWVHRDGAVELVAREGSPAPGTSPSSNFSSFSTRGSDLPVINASGKVAFSAVMQGPNFGRGVWAEDLAGMLRLIVRQGDLLEVAPGDFRTVSSLSFRGDTAFEGGRGGAGFNDSGQVAFHATFTDGSSGVFVSNLATVPEPAALVLAAFPATLGIAAMRRSRKRPQQSGTSTSWRATRSLKKNAFTSSLARMFTLASVLGSPSLAAAAATNDTLRTVALRGQPAPGAAAGAVFQAFSNAPILNASGLTAFAASLQQVGGVTGANDTGIWSEGSGALTLVAREGSPAPGMPAETRFASFPFNPPGLNDAGQTAFVTLTQGGGVISSNDAGIWSELDGPLALVVREGTPFVGEPTDAVFSSFSMLRISESHVGFSARLPSGPGGVTTANDSGIWRSSGAALEVVAREGSPAPGTEAGVLFRDFDGITFALGAGGHVAFLGRLPVNVAGVTVDNDTGIWTAGSGPLALLAREGSQAPGTQPGVNFGGTGFGPPSINAVGQAAFYASLRIGGSVTSDNDSGIWVQNGSAPALVVREGDPAPGTPPGAAFGSFFNPPAINTEGEIAFVGSLRTGIGGVTVNNDSGIWVNRDGAIDLVAREGSPAPGTPPGATFSHLSIRGSNLPVINSAGRVAFLGNVQGLTFAAGIWAEDLAGMLRLIVRQGDSLEVAPGDFRTVSSLTFRGESAFEDNRRGSGFNDLGQVAFHAQFTDGSSGIFVSNLATVPEPTAVALAAVMGIMVTGLKRRDQLGGSLALPTVHRR